MIRRTTNDNERNGPQEIIDKAIEEMAREAGDSFELDRLNLAEFSRRTGLTRSKARTLKGKGFVVTPHGRCGMRAESTVISGFEGVVNALLMEGVTNPEVVFGRIEGQGHKGGKTTVKNCVKAHAALVPAKRKLAKADPQGSRGRRFETEPGESCQRGTRHLGVADPAWGSACVNPPARADRLGRGAGRRLEFVGWGWYRQRIEIVYRAM